VIGLKQSESRDEETARSGFQRGQRTKGTADPLGPRSGSERVAGRLTAWVESGPAPSLAGTGDVVR
jgi:hypothetical protein